MKIIVAFIFILLLLTNFGHSKTINVMILGYVDKPNINEFGKSAFYFIQRAQKKGQEVYFGSPMKYPFVKKDSKNMNFQYVETKEDVKKILNTVGKNVEPGDKVNLFINGHGFPTRNQTRPKETGIQLMRDKLTHKDLDEMLWGDDNNTGIPFGTGIKIIAPYCFSGGILSVASNRPNSCGVTATDFRTPSYGEGDIFSGTTTAYGSVMSKMLRDNPRMSLGEAHQKVALNDFRNDQRGSVTSLDYLKRIYNESPYKKTQSWFKRLFSDKAPTSPLPNPINKLCPDLNKDDYIDNESLEPFIMEVEKIVQNLEITNLFENPNIPEHVVDGYRKIWEDYQQNFDKFLNFYNETSTMYSAMMSSAADENNMRTMDWQVQNLLHELKQEVRQSFVQLMALYKYKEDIKLINKFYHDYTPGESIVRDNMINHYEELVKCEREEF